MGSQNDRSTYPADLFLESKELLPLEPPFGKMLDRLLFVYGLHNVSYIAVYYLVMLCGFCSCEIGYYHAICRDFLITLSVDSVSVVSVCKSGLKIL